MSRNNPFEGLFRDLGPGAYARNTDPETSHKAKERVEHILNEIEQDVYYCARRAGDRGVTTAEVCQQTGRHAWSISPRFAPLRKYGYLTLKVNALGKTVTRGRQQVNFYTGKRYGGQ